MAVAHVVIEKNGSRLSRAVVWFEMRELHLIHLRWLGSRGHMPTTTWQTATLISVTQTNFHWYWLNIYFCHYSILSPPIHEINKMPQFVFELRTTTTYIISVKFTMELISTNRKRHKTAILNGTNDIDK